MDKNDPKNVISARQCRAARALLNISQEELAVVSRVSKPTITAFERGARTPHTRTLYDLRMALEGQGVVFIDGADGIEGAGVRKGERRAGK